MLLRGRSTDVPNDILDQGVCHNCPCDYYPGSDGHRLTQVDSKSGPKFGSEIPPGLPSETITVWLMAPHLDQSRVGLPEAWCV